VGFSFFSFFFVYSVLSFLGNTSAGHNIAKVSPLQISSTSKVYQKLSSIIASAVSCLRDSFLFPTFRLHPI
jgi:hypothetical protein